MIEALRIDAFSLSRRPTWPTARVSHYQIRELNEAMLYIPSREQTTLIFGPSSLCMIDFTFSSCFPSLSSGEYTPDSTILPNRRLLNGCQKMHAYESLKLHTFCKRFSLIMRHCSMTCVTFGGKISRPSTEHSGLKEGIRQNMKTH